MSKRQRFDDQIRQQTSIYKKICENAQPTMNGIRKKFRKVKLLES